MVLPLGLLNSSRKTAILVEVKSGETYNGSLGKCDVWMNLHLTDVVKTSSDGEHFFKMNEVFIRGSAIKYIRLPEDVMDIAKEVNRRPPQQNRGGGGNRGGVRGGGSRGGYRGGSSRGGSNRGGRGGGASVGHQNNNQQRERPTKE